MLFHIKTQHRFDDASNLMRKPNHCPATVLLVDDHHTTTTQAKNHTTTQAKKRRPFIQRLLNWGCKSSTKDSDREGSSSLLANTMLALSEYRSMREGEKEFACA